MIMLNLTGAFFVMPDNNATILIPDISGFTAFMTNNELSHASHAINILIEDILSTVGDSYQVSEIEGDAVLLIKRGPPPSQQEIFDLCLDIFRSFHWKRKWMQQHTVCPCGACQAIINLTLKFVAHYGPLAEIKIGGFVKQSGTEMIVAHRLLKNSIEHHEYILLTEKLLQAAAKTAEDANEWIPSSEEYPSLGTVTYRYMLLDQARENVPDPPPLKDYVNDDTVTRDTWLQINFEEACMALVDIPSRPKWMPKLQTVEQEGNNVFIGSVHHCKFTNYTAEVSPLRMTSSPEGVLYAESWIIEEQKLSLVYEYVFRKESNKECLLSYRYLNSGDDRLSAETAEQIFDDLQNTVQQFKQYCETLTQTTN